MKRRPNKTCIAQIRVFGPNLQRALTRLPRPLHEASTTRSALTVLQALLLALGVSLGTRRPRAQLPCASQSTNHSLSPFQCRERGERGGRRWRVAGPCEGGSRQWGRPGGLTRTPQWELARCLGGGAAPQKGAQGNSSQGES